MISASTAANNAAVRFDLAIVGTMRPNVAADIRARGNGCELTRT